MSLYHICLNGKQDVDLDVKSLKIQGQTVTPGGGGNPFNQDLNTTDQPRFDQLRLTSTTFIDSDQCVTKQYVDDSISGLPVVDLQSAYDDGNGEIALSISKPLEITGTAGVNVNSNPVLTSKLTFNDSQELVSKQFVDDSLQSLAKTTVLFDQSQDYLVVNGGFYTDGNITLGWDAINQTEFLLNTLPSTGGVTVSSINGGTGTSVLATQANFKYDIGGLVASSGILQSWIHANTDASYPNYYITILRLGGGENSILTVEKY